MRKALVVTKEFLGRSVGQIEKIGPAAEIDALTGNFYNTSMQKVDLPETYGNLPLVGKVVEEGNEVAEYWFKDEEIVTTKPEVQAWVDTLNGNAISYLEPSDLNGFLEVQVLDPEWTEVPAEVAGANIVIDWAKYFEDQIKEAKTAMNAAIYAEVFNYFQTSDREAAVAWEGSWRAKAANPADYANDGLIVIHTSTSFQTLGEPLDTTQKISDHFSELMIERVQAFDKFRDSKIAEFLQTQANITQKIQTIPS